ncbi:hypothetical protein FQA39_LY04191 [Lamprigera yunnana]|nr:hypothetical protein FQA39_LY04191 [Lamprigera yunnana]
MMLHNILFHIKNFKPRTLTNSVNALATDTSKTFTAPMQIFPDKTSTVQTPTSVTNVNQQITPDCTIKEPPMFLKLEHLEPVPQSEVLRKSVSFDEMPGPKYLRYLAKLWSFFPIMGTQVTASAMQYLLSAGRTFGSRLSWGKSSSIFERILDRYGPVVRLHGPLGGNVVVLSRSEDAATVFQNEGLYPIRSCLDCLEKYRSEYNHFKHAGPFIMYGPDWEKLRNAIEGPLLTVTEHQLKLINKTSEEFVARILRVRNRQDEVPPLFRNEITKWAIECMCSIVLNKHLGFLDPNGLSASSEAAYLLDSLNGATTAVRRCESGIHLWKFVNTPAWKALVKQCDILGNILNKYISKTQHNLEQKKAERQPLTAENVSFIETLFLKDRLLSEDILTVLLDTMLIGVNTVAHSIAFLLYNLAQNPKVQRKLYQEVSSEFNLGKNVTSLTYLSACIKESLRLNPPMPILSRVLSQDTIVHNYRIPKGTYILIGTHLSSMREEYFEDAHRFKPERWLNEELYLDNENLFAIMPFGHGQKSYIAQAIAEVQISSLMTKIVSQFRIEYHYGKIQSTNRLLAMPDRPLKFTFVDRM